MTLRIQRLDLTRYGKFTDFSLAFGPRPAEGPDFHVIYGPNEGGKSTTLQAWLDFLFEIKLKSSMNFLHDYNTMAIGATVDIHATPLTLQRIKRRNNTLLAAHGAPVPEETLRAAVLGLDRQNYEAMFSLNGETLSAGGETILASEGELGQLLFSASAGLSALSQGMRAQRAKAQDFLADSGRKGALLELRRRYDALGKEIKEADTGAAAYARLMAARDTQEQQAKTAADAVQTATKALHRAQRLSAAWPLADKLERLRAKIKTYDDLPSPPAHWIQQRAELSRAEAAHIAARNTLETQEVSIETALADLVEDPAMEAAQSDLDHAQTLFPAYDTALQDLAKRQDELAKLEGTIAHHLEALEAHDKDPASITIAPHHINAMRQLLTRVSGLQTALQSARDEEERATRTAAGAAAELAEAKPPKGDAQGLRRLLEALRRSAPQEAFDAAQTHDMNCKNRLSARTQALLPWRGDVMAVAAPSEKWMHSARETLTETDLAQREARAAQTQQETRLAQAQAQLAALGTTPGIEAPDPQKTRAEREALWAVHRRDLTSTSADAFEYAMRRDDQAALAQGLRHAAEEKRATLHASIREMGVLLQELTEKTAACEAQKREAQEAIQARIKTLSPAFPEEFDLEDLAQWLRRLESARQEAQTASESARALDLATANLERARRELAAALATAGEDIPADMGLEARFGMAESVLKRHEAAAQLQTAAKNAQTEAQKRADARGRAERDMDAWRRDWRAACAETWLADDRRPVAAMGVVLEQLDALYHARNDHRDLAHRVHAMEANKARFEGAVRALAQRLDMAQEADTATIWRAIEARNQAANATKERKAQLQEDLVGLRTRQEDAARDMATHRALTSEIIGFFGVTGWTQAQDALERCHARAELIATETETEELLCKQMQTPDVASAHDQLHGTDRDTLLGEEAALPAQIEVLNSAAHEAHARFIEAQRAVSEVGGDDLVAQLHSERQTLALEIATRSRAHLRQRLGMIAVDHALRQYRDEHRSDMLRHASDAFRRMTGGAYAGLATQPDDLREILVAKAANGASKQAHQLSDGTRAQLYLALRIAGYYEFVKTKGAVPFVADDIMESFDDTRSRAALSLLADMGHQGQVIYLTHHEHIVEMAREICPTAHVHRLDA